MALFDRLADRRVVVAAWDLERAAQQTQGFERVTTTVVARGDGHAGRGEDVTYETADHDALRADPPALPTGTYTFAGLSAALDEVATFPEPPSRETARDYRRWALESAALDLLLRQAGESLGAALDRSYDPVGFVASPRLGDPPTLDRLDALAARVPGVGLKLDPEPSWDAALLDELADRDVRVVDLKGHYRVDGLGPPAEPGFYRRVLEQLPTAVVEDPVVDERTRPVLAELAADRIAWDAPIHALADLEAAPLAPARLNVKPSRFGTVAELLATVEHCLDADVGLYGGGQFELGVGRAQAQALASLFYPDAPNDLAPSAYNADRLPAELPASPLEPVEPVGLGLGQGSGSAR